MNGVDSRFLLHVETYGELRPHLAREWLLTNERGGYAMGTVVGANTRRYHGLLCAEVGPPVGRVMALSRVHETLEMLDGNPDKPPLELSVAHTRAGGGGGGGGGGEVVNPRGDRYLRRVSVGDAVRWDYDVADVHVEKELRLDAARNAVSLRYRVNPSLRGRVRLTLRPLVALRAHHALCRAAAAPDVLGGGGDAPVKVGSRDRALWLQAEHLRWQVEGDWWFGQHYPRDADRGEDDAEDLFVPGRFVAELAAPGEVVLHAWLDDEGEASRRPEFDALQWERTQRRERLRPMPTPTQARLARAAEAFIVRRDRAGVRGAGVLAGYPWFTDWGRDAAIALPGLLLATGRLAEAGQVLTMLAAHVADGLVPKRFDERTGEPDYASVDTSLWFVDAVHRWRAASRDEDVYAGVLRPACEAVLDGYRAGTRHGIGVDPADGLVFTGADEPCLTWMDAHFAGEAMAPRCGKAVEVNALWFNALSWMGEADDRERVGASFLAAFQLAPHKGLADTARGGPGSGAGGGGGGGYERDESVRPNQVFAASLAYSPLDREGQRSVVDRVRRHLLTPVGLRSLSPQDSRYVGEYQGDARRRARACHNGAVWAWLIGPFLDAYLNAYGRSPDTLAQARAWLAPLVAQLDDGCLNHIAECFDGDAPHRPSGSPAQAWSVAEVLRLAIDLEV